MGRASIAAGLAVLGYLAGSIPSGLIFGRMFTGRDVRTVGSGNIGAANVSRVAGYRVAVLVLLFDVLKGLGPVLAGRALRLNPIELSIIAGAAVLGHDFSAFLKLSGGKGVATTLGVALALAPVVALSGAVIWLISLGIWRFSSVASLIALWSLPVLMAIFDQPVEYVPLTAGLALLGFYTHRENLSRLSAGEEARLVRRSLG